jgi:aspartokinase
MSNVIREQLGKQLTVAKFGGTSMAEPEAVAEIIEARPDHRVIVVSAPG